METDSFVFEEQDFQFEKEPDFWQLSLKRSKVGTQNLQQLQLLEIHHSLLMPMTQIPFNFNSRQKRTLYLLKALKKKLYLKNYD